MKLSVLITTYNHENYIAQAIDGALMQETDFDFEIIIGEDDSEDNTRAIVKKYKERYPDKIKLFLNDRENIIYVDGKPTGKWNWFNCFNNASGKYIAMLDGDDYWTSKDKLALQVAVMEEREDIVASCHNTIIMENGSSIRNFSNFNKNELSFIDVTSYTSPFHTSSYVFRRSKFIRPEWFNYITSVDMAIFSIIASQGITYYFDKVFSVYRKHKGGITNQPFHHGYYLHFNRIKLIDFLLDTLTLNEEQMCHLNRLKKEHVQGINKYFFNRRNESLLEKFKRKLLNLF